MTPHKHQRPRVSTDLLTAVGDIFTKVRLVWIVVTLAVGGIGTGVGMLVRSGAARAQFEGRVAEVERRVTANEQELVEARFVRTQILAKLNTVEGSLDTIKALLMRRTPGAHP